MQMIFDTSTIEQANGLVLFCKIYFYLFSFA